LATRFPCLFHATTWAAIGASAIHAQRQLARACRYYPHPPVVWVACPLGHRPVENTNGWLQCQSFGFQRGYSVIFAHSAASAALALACPDPLPHRP